MPDPFDDDDFALDAELDTVVSGDPDFHLKTAACMMPMSMPSGGLHHRRIAVRRNSLRCEMPPPSASILGPANRFAPVAEDSVRVFLSQEELRDRGYEWEAVALLFGSGSSMYTTDRGMLQTIRREAGKVGANGIILADTREPSSAERWLAGAGAQRKSTMTAIRWRVRPPATDSARTAKP